MAKKTYRILSIAIDCENCEVTLVDRNGRSHVALVSAEACFDLDRVLAEKTSVSQTYSQADR